MKRILLACCLLCVAVAGAAHAQETGKSSGQELDANPLTDALLEVDAKKNLKAAQLYFTRKAYVGALQRCEETIAVYQRFKKLDEMLYIAGMSSARLSRKEGKQPLPAGMTGDKYLILARLYLSQLVNDHPKSGFRKRAEEELRSIGNAPTQADAKQ